jgi:hypothetical protein
MNEVKTISDRILGMPVDVARSYVENRNLLFHVISKDAFTTCDYNPGRVNVKVCDGKVTKVLWY